MVAPVPNGRFVGYARVSTDDQDLSLQIDSLTGLGINHDDIFTEKISGAKTDRPELNACLAKLQRGDTLVVWRLDRLGRSMHPWSSSRVVESRGRLSIRQRRPHRQNEPIRRIDLSHLLGPRTVRASFDSGANQSWPSIGASKRQTWWPPTDRSRRSESTGCKTASR